MPVNGRQKGSKAEREIAVLLAGWWSKVEPDAIWKRTPLSGGWADAGTRAGFNASGDLMTTAQHFPFCVEVKKREAWSVDAFVKSPKKSPVMAWWDQAIVQAKEMSKLPLLIFSKNRQPWRVLLHEFDHIEAIFGLTPITRFSRIVNKKRASVVCYELSILLDVNPRLFVGAHPR